MCDIYSLINFMLAAAMAAKGYTMQFGDNTAWCKDQFVTIPSDMTSSHSIEEAGEGSFLHRVGDHLVVSESHTLTFIITGTPVKWKSVHAGMFVESSL